MSYLARLRKARDLSQSQLAALIDADHSTISRIEAGSRLPSASLLDRIACALELDDYATFELFEAYNVPQQHHPVVREVARTMVLQAGSKRLHFQREIQQVLARWR